VEVRDEVSPKHCTGRSLTPSPHSWQMNASIGDRPTESMVLGVDVARVSLRIVGPGHGCDRRSRNTVGQEIAVGQEPHLLEVVARPLMPSCAPSARTTLLCSSLLFLRAIVRRYRG
jgi:hypothetical protein